MPLAKDDDPTLRVAKGNDGVAKFTRWVSHRMRVMVYLPTFWVNFLLVKGWFPNTQWGEKSFNLQVGRIYI